MGVNSKAQIQGTCNIFGYANNTHIKVAKPLNIVQFKGFVFIGLAYYQGKKDIVFRFIIEYSSLRDFGPY